MFPVRVLGFAAIALLLLGAGTAKAALIVTFSQDGANVDAIGVGSLNLGSLTYSSQFFGSPYVDASAGAVLLDTVPAAGADVYVGTISGPTTFGPGGNNPATSGGSTAPQDSGARHRRSPR
jgi:hypothetical protein